MALVLACRGVPVYIWPLDPKARNALEHQCSEAKLGKYDMRSFPLILPIHVLGFLGEGSFMEPWVAQFCLIGIFRVTPIPSVT